MALWLAKIAKGRVPHQIALAAGTDSPAEQRGFEPPVPGAEAITKRNRVLREDCPPNQLKNNAAALS